VPLVVEGCRSWQFNLGTGPSGFGVPYGGWFGFSTHGDGHWLQTWLVYDQRERSGSCIGNWSRDAFTTFYADVVINPGQAWIPFVEVHWFRTSLWVIGESHSIWFQYLDQSAKAIFLASMKVSALTHS